MHSVSDDFWPKLFIVTKKAFLQILIEQRSFESTYTNRGSVESDYNFLVEQTIQVLKNEATAETNLRLVLEHGSVDNGTQNFDCSSGVHFNQYLKNIRAALAQGGACEHLSKALKARLLLKLDNIASSTVNSKPLTALHGQNSSTSKKSAQPSETMLEKWEKASDNNTAHQVRPALKKIVSKSLRQPGTTLPIEVDVTTDRPSSNRAAVSSQLKNIFSGKDLAIARKHVSIVSETYNFDQGLQALEKINDLFNPDENTPEDNALRTLKDITRALSRAAADTTCLGSSTALNSLYASKKVDIEDQLKILYGLKPTEGANFSNLVQKKYDFWPSFFTAKKRRQAIEQYVAACDNALIVPTAETTKPEFDQVFARSKVLIGKKRAFQAYITGLEQGWSSEITEIAKAGDDTFRADITQALFDLYSSSDSLPTATPENILNRVKSACGWLPTWKDEYKTAKKLVAAIDNVPMDKELIKTLTAQLTQIWNGKSKVSDSAKESLAKLDTSVKSTWASQLTSTMKTQETEIDRHKSDVSNAVDSYIASKGYPVTISQTREDCDYFISEIFSQNLGEFNRINFDNNKFSFNDSEARVTNTTHNFLAKAREVFIIADQNQYFVLVFLVLELARIQGLNASYELELKTLLFNWLEKNSSYSSDLPILKTAGAPEWLTNYIPASIHHIGPSKANELKELINAVLTLPVAAAQISSAANSPTASAASSNKTPSKIQTQTSVKDPKNAEEIDNMDLTDFQRYAEVCAHQVVDHAYRPILLFTGGYHQPITTLLKQYLGTPSKPGPYATARKSVLLTYTLWQWYKTQTGFGQIVFRSHASKKDQWTNIIHAPCNGFIAAMESVLKQNTKVVDTNFTLPEQDMEGYPYQRNSLQRLVDRTKTIFPDLNPRHSDNITTDDESSIRSGSDRSETTTPLAGNPVAHFQPADHAVRGAKSAPHAVVIR